LDLSWAAQELQIAKTANDAAQRQFDEHVETHAQPAVSGAGA
jgi:hypothetical protein